MNNLPRTITLISNETRKRRIIHLISNKTEKSFKSASAKCNIWVLKNGFPISLKVNYGESSNEMICNELAELRYGLQTFVKEYIDETDRCKFLQ